MSFETKATIKTFGGQLLKLSHESAQTKTPMSVYIYLPPGALTTSTSPSTENDKKKVPVLIYLSGLTCTPDNCAEKGYLHASAARHGIAVVYPDTSPRGAGVQGEDVDWDFGTGAGFYVDATVSPWSRNYNMYSYIREELLSVLFSSSSKVGKEKEIVLGEILDKERISITGHSMGGHGALTLYLKNPNLFRSVSAFAPIANPTQCPWGQKAFSGYLGQNNQESWKEYDATELVSRCKGKDLRCLVDVGTGDNFYKQGQLLPENFEAAVREAGVKGVEVRYQADYDHSYFFISSFAEDHVNHAAKYLLAEDN